MKKKDKKLLFTIIFLIIALIAQSFYKPSQSSIQEVEKITADYNDLQIFFMDVGQADCILIRNQNQNMLIDAGNNEDGQKLVNYFKLKVTIGLYLSRSIASNIFKAK